MTGVITSLPPVIQQPPGNNSSNPAGLPGVTYTAAVPTLPQTWTALQTFLSGTIELSGATSGNTFLNASAIASGTLVLPAIVGSDTLLSNNNVATVTNKSIDGTTNTLTNINAANISSGTLPSGRLPNPSAATLGGIQSAAAVSHQWINSISTSGVPALSQPAFADISGSIAATQLPNPTATTLGGIESLAAISHLWINTISTSGVPTATQPAFTDISGSIAAGQIPANVLTNAMAAQMAAATIKGNVTGSTANASDFTIQGLVNLAAPSPTLDFIPIYDHVSGTIKNATPSSVGAAGAVSSIGTQVGALTIAGGNLSSTVIPVARYDAAQTLTTTQQDQLRSNTAIQSGGGYANVFATGSSSTITITADAVSLFNSSGNVFGATSVSLSLVVSGSGANGLDTGSVATNQYYYFVIYNPATGTVAALASLSSTAPTMPSGYTYKRRIGWFNYSGGITSFVQRNSQFTWASTRTIASGTQVTAAFFTLATFVSPAATRVFGYAVTNNNNVTIGDAAGSTILQISGVTSGQCLYSWSITPQNTTYQMQYTSSSAGGALTITGWEDNI
jgi:hypothetical protein